MWMFFWELPFAEELLMLWNIVYETDLLALMVLLLRKVS